MHSFQITGFERVKANEEAERLSRSPEHNHAIAMHEALCTKRPARTITQTAPSPLYSSSSSCAPRNTSAEKNHYVRLEDTIAEIMDIIEQGATS